jgi:hypothetical protein
MRGELAGDGSGRHEQPVARNKKLKNDNEDDAPTYVLEDTNQSLSKAEYEAMVAGDDAKEDDAAADETATEDSTTGPKKQSKNNITEVGKVSKKRKVAKVIGEEKDDKTTAKSTETKMVKKPKKKSKPVKLTFGDEEG